MRVLVLGAGGFLGAYIVRSFIGHGWRVAAGRRAGSDDFRLPPTSMGLTRHIIDLCDLDREPGWAEVMAQPPDVLVNCAAYGVNPRDVDGAMAMAVNATALTALVTRSAAAGVRRVIHLGSAAEYGCHPGAIAEESHARPTSIYGRTKLAGTMLALEAGSASGMEVCVVRPFGCYGAFEASGKFIPDFIAALRQGQPIDLSPGTQLRDYIHASDAAEAIVALADPKLSVGGHIYNICSGVPVTIRKLGETLVDVMRSDHALARWGALAARPNETATLVGSPERLQRQTKWRPRKSLQEGLAKTVVCDWE